MVKSAHNCPRENRKGDSYSLPKMQWLEIIGHLGVSDFQAELTNLPIFPNLSNLLPILPDFVKIKNPLNVLKFKYFIIFYFILG